MKPILSTILFAALTVNGLFGQSITPQQLGMLKWYGSSENLVFPTGNNPQGMVFDGSSIWISHYVDNTLWKIRPGDGALLGKYVVGSGNMVLAFDGANIWATNLSGNTVTKVRASDGTVLGTYKTFNQPYAIAYDGQNIWVGNCGDSSVVQLNANGAVANSYTLASCPMALAYDGQSMWIGYSDGNLIKLTKGQVTGKINIGLSRALAFDGANIWATNYNGGTVTKVNAAQVAVLGVYPVGAAHPTGIAFDGTSMWIANQDGGVTQMSPGGAYKVHSAQICPDGVVFDGANIWVTNSLSNSVSKF